MCFSSQWGFRVMSEFVSHLSRCHLHPSVPAPDRSVPAECVSVSSSQCAAVASPSSPCPPVMGPLSCGSGCWLDHPAELSIPAASGEGERIDLLLKRSFLSKDTFGFCFQKHFTYILLFCNYSHLMSLTDRFLKV